MQLFFRVMHYNFSLKLYYLYPYIKHLEFIWQSMSLFVYLNEISKLGRFEARKKLLHQFAIQSFKRYNKAYGLFFTDVSNYNGYLWQLRLISFTYCCKKKRVLQINVNKELNPELSSRG